MREIRLLALLLVATLFVQNVAAGLLPYSTHYQGRSYFDDPDAGVTGWVDFAVYDTLGSYEDEWGGAGFDAPGDGRYIYAYQIFSDDGSTDAIELFTIMGIDDHQLSGIDTITSQDPWEGYSLITEGVEPTDADFSPDETRGTWKFSDGLLIAGEYSWFLILSSANDWVEGEYLIQTASGFPVPPGINPEPCTLALLGLGSVILFVKRRNSVKSHRVRSHN
jgi:hypothetical protein